MTAIPHSTPTRPRLRFTVTTPFLATSETGHRYRIVWSRDRDAYVLTVDDVERYTSRTKIASVVAANQIEFHDNPAVPPANAEAVK